MREKIHQIETTELKELREGFFIIFRRTEKLLSEMNTQAIFHREFFREISWIHKLIQQLDRRSKSKSLQ